MVAAGAGRRAVGVFWNGTGTRGRKKEALGLSPLAAVGAFLPENGGVIEGVVRELLRFTNNWRLGCLSLKSVTKEAELVQRVVLAQSFDGSTEGKLRNARSSLEHVVFSRVAAAGVEGSGGAKNDPLRRPTDWSAEGPAMSNEQGLSFDLSGVASP